MKSLRKITAIALTAAMTASFAACNSKQTQETSVTSDTSVINIETGATGETSASGAETQITNENGEFLIDGETFEERYGSQLGSYLNHQYTFDDIKIPQEESNYYMIHQFVEFNNMAKGGYDLPLTSEGLVDLSYEFSDGLDVEGYDITNVGDMMKSYAEVSIACTYICLDLGKEYGIEISDRTYSKTEDQIEVVRTLATDTGLTLDQFLSVNYGPGFTEQDFRDILINYYYYEDFVDAYPIPEELTEVPTVVHALFEAREGLTTPDEDTAAYNSASEFLASCMTTDDIMTKGTKLAEEKIVAECAQYQVVKGKFVKEFQDWAYDETRQVGDMGIVKTSFGYHVMGFLGMEPLSDEERNYLASELASDEIYSVFYAEVHDFGTDDEYSDPVPVVGETVETEETVAESLRLDENGNIIIETTATDPALKIGADKESKGVMVTRIIAACVGGVAIFAIIGLIIATIAGDKKKKDEETDDETEDFSEETIKAEPKVEPKKEKKKED